MSSAHHSEPSKPEREYVTLRDGEQIAVRQLTYVDTMKLDRVADPIVEDLCNIQNWSTITQTDINEIFSDHEQEYLQLLSAATDLSVHDIEALSAQEGYLISLLFWGLNVDFFVQRTMAVMARRHRNKLN